MAEQARVLVIMGSDSDLEQMRDCLAQLDALQIPFAAHVSSAHRSPARTAELVGGAEERGVRVIIAAAGLAAHLAGAAAAQTTLPVLGVPLQNGALGGLDALLATVQMPPGVPVATLAVGPAGARNAALLAAQILALSDAGLAERLRRLKAEMAREVEQRDARLQEKLRG